jgi:hypothetical protein
VGERVGVASPGRDRLVDVVEALRSPAPQVVERQVASHGEEPRAKRPLAVVAGNPLGHLQPRLLEHVLGHGLVSHQPQQVPEEAVLMAAHQADEPGGVAPAQARGVVPVRIHRPSPRCGPVLLPLRAGRGKGRR